MARLLNARRSAGHRSLEKGQIASELALLFFISAAASLVPSLSSGSSLQKQRMFKRVAGRQKHRLPFINLSVATSIPSQAHVTQTLLPLVRHSTEEKLREHTQPSHSSVCFRSHVLVMHILVLLVLPCAIRARCSLKASSQAPAIQGLAAFH